MDDGRTAICDKKWLSELRLQPRDYQLELLDAALEENTIVNLGTGAGKTFIAVMLIRELQHEILGPWPACKRTLFVVTSGGRLQDISPLSRLHSAVYTDALASIV